MALEMLPKREKERERMNLGEEGEIFLRFLHVCISNGWKIISDKAVNFVCPYKNTVIFF